MRYNLFYQRQRHGYSQTDMSDLLNISLRQYQRIESGESDGKVKIWILISSILNDTIENLLINSNTKKEK